ncbi:hypothetical protein [Paenibacillus gansuensis]|uniref:Methyltransferase n=1 Tax=Paenibacillus gansuensis TaxID=306542 RepID=A0ABW5PA27_9BACL
MSRKWERMVQKNTKVTNKVRAKQGKLSISNSPGSASEVKRHTGRSFLLPIGCAVIAIFFAIAFAVQQGAMYWFTVISYLLLAVVFYFRKPYLAIGKDYISTRKFGGDRKMYAAGLEKIVAQPGYVVVHLKHSKSNWVFSRVFNRYDTDKMAADLQTFAKQHAVPFEEKAN